jgi:hypothetical protein
MAYSKLTPTDMNQSVVRTMEHKAGDILLTAWVKDSPNSVPVARAEFRSTALAGDTARLWRSLGWRVEREDR